MTARIRRDLIACVVILLAVYALEWRFALLDRFVDTGNYFGPIDEAMLAVAATTTVTLAFAIRRLSDLRNDGIREAASERALIQSEARASLLFDRAPQPMWVFDEETGRFLAVNDAAAQ